MNYTKTICMVLLAGLVTGAWAEETKPAASKKPAQAAPAKKSLGMKVEPCAKPAGLKVTEVYPKSVAAAAGIQVGDVIVEAGDAAITGYDTLAAALKASGKTMTLRLKRGVTTINTAADFNAPAAQPNDLGPGGMGGPIVLGGPNGGPIVIRVGGANGGVPPQLRAQVAKMQKQMQEQMKKAMAGGGGVIRIGGPGGAMVRSSTTISAPDENGKQTTVKSDGKSYTVTRGGVTNTYDTKAALDKADPAAAKLLGKAGMRIRVGGGNAPMPPMPDKAPPAPKAEDKAGELDDLLRRGGPPLIAPKPKEEMVTISKKELQARIDAAVKAALAKAKAEPKK